MELPDQGKYPAQLGGSTAKSSSLNNAPSTRRPFSHLREGNGQKPPQQIVSAIRKSTGVNERRPTSTSSRSGHFIEGTRQSPAGVPPAWRRRALEGRPRTGRAIRPE